MKTSLWAVAAAGLLCLAAAPALAAVPPAPPVIESVTFTGSHSVNLTGTTVATATIDVHITAADGQSDGGAQPPNQCVGIGGCVTTPYLEVSQTAGPANAELWYATRNLTLVSGTATDGVWRGTLSFTAWQAGGTFKISHVVALGGSDNNADFQNDVFVDPATLGADTTVAVTGSDAPYLGVSTKPATIPSGYKGKVTTYYLLYLRDSKTPLAGRPITMCLDNDCEAGYSGGDVVTTDSTGRASKTWDYGQNAWAMFYRLNAGQYFDDVIYDASDMAPSAAYGRRATLSGSVSPTSIPLGATATLSGKSSPTTTGARSIVIQKWVGGAWSELGRANLRDSGRWDYTTKPGAKGNYVYRAWRPTSGCDHAERCTVAGTTTGSVNLTVR